MVQEYIHNLPNNSHWKFQVGWVVFKTRDFKGKYMKLKCNFHMGWVGFKPLNLPWGVEGGGYFLEQHTINSHILYIFLHTFLVVFMGRICLFKTYMCNYHYFLYLYDLIFDHLIHIKKTVDF